MPCGQHTTRPSSRSAECRPKTPSSPSNAREAAKVPAASRLPLGATGRTLNPARQSVHSSPQTSGIRRCFQAPWGRLFRPFLPSLDRLSFVHFATVDNHFELSKSIRDIYVFSIGPDSFRCMHFKQPAVSVEHLHLDQRVRIIHREKLISLVCSNPGPRLTHESAPDFLEFARREDINEPEPSWEPRLGAPGA